MNPAAKEPLGQVIAERRLYSVSDRAEQVLVRFGLPRAMADGRDFICPYEISGTHGMLNRQAAGVDTVQALLCAVHGAEAQIDYLNRSYYGGTLRWLSDTTTDLGFDLPRSAKG